MAWQVEESPWPRRPNPVRLLGMPSAYLRAPFDGMPDDDPVGEESSLLAAESLADLDRYFQLDLAPHNPFFDFKRRIDPGGAGYYRVYSQVLLAEGGTTGLSLGFRALTPAGVDADGIKSGPTVLSPHLGWFQELGNEITLQAFLGKSVRVRPGWSESMARDVRYGLALQRPISFPDNNYISGLHMYVEALGHYRCDPILGLEPAMRFEVVPGMHWQVNDRWWLSWGLLFPLGVHHYDNRLWQLTCSRQF
jgi:hypothetical protein